MKRIIFSAAIVMSTLGLVAAEAHSALADTPRIGSLSSTQVGLDQKTITLTPPTSNSPGAWVVTLADPTIASVNGLTLTLLKAGSTQMTFTQEASGVFTSDSRMAVLIVTPGTPVVGSWILPSVTLASASYTINPPTSSSNGVWTYSLANNTVAGHQIATLSAATLTLLDAGTITINATQLATNNWKSATASTTLTITAPKPTIGSFTNVTIAKDSVSSLALTPPTSNSTGVWSFTSSNSSVASATGTTITPVGVGTTTITAYQAPAGGFSSATTTMVLTVTAAAPAVGTFAPITYAFGSVAGNTVTLVPPTSNSPGAWSFKIADPSIATINGTTLTALKPGLTTITATQQASGNFNSSAPQTVALTITAVPSYISLPNLTQVVGDPARQITPPTSLSTGVWSATSSNPGVVSVNGLSLAFGNAGTATITLTQAAAAPYLAGSTTFTVNVSGLVPTIGTLAPVTIHVGDKISSIPNPTSNSAGNWVYSVADPSIASVNNGVLTGNKVGTTMITATQQPAGKYGQSNTVQAVLTVVAAIAPTPTPTPTPSVKPTPTPKPSVIKPSVTPTPVKKPAVVPVVTVTNAGHIIKIAAKGGKVTASINGAPAKVGANTVKAGDNLVIVEFDGQVIYSRAITVK